MSDNLEHIDNYFKSNIDKINVEYNAAHWDKLQKSLLVAAAAGTAVAVTTSKWQAVLKFLKLHKLFFIGIPSVVIVTTGVVYFSSKNPKTENVIPVMKDSVQRMITASPVLPDTQSPSPISKNLYFTPAITSVSDTPKYISPYLKDTAKYMVSPFKKDTSFTSKKDTLQKKKNLNVFW